MKFKNKFIPRLAGYSMASIAIFVISFIAVPLMTRLYSPAELGMISLFQSVLGIFLVVVLVGQDQAFTRFYFEVGEKDKLLSVNLRICLFAWLLTLGITIALAAQISKIALGEVNKYAIIMCALGTLPSLIVRMSTQLYRVKNATKAYVIFNIITNVTTKIGIVAIALVSPRANVWLTTYIIIYTLIAIIITIVQIKKYHLKFHFKANKELTRELRRFGSPLLVSSFVYLLIAWLPKAILSNVADMAEVGIFASAIALAAAINLVENGLNTYFSVYFYENYKTDKGEVNLIHHGLVAISCIVMIMMTMCGPFIVLLVGDKYRPAIVSFPFVVCANIFYAASETTVHGIDVKKKTYLHVVISALSAITGGVVTFLAAKNLGAVGAAMGYCSALVAFFFLRTILGQKELKLVHDLWLTAIGFIAMLWCATINAFFSEWTMRHYMECAILLGIAIIYLCYFRKKTAALKHIAA
ncbi:MAG: oligosaccharide flippase family protein [Oscillospiraceae bacterium]|nr:oligosaccharide flippase family protein [Oscillospiraceae bacterium]